MAKNWNTVAQNLLLQCITNKQITDEMFSRKLKKLGVHFSSDEVKKQRVKKSIRASFMLVALKSMDVNAIDLSNI